MVLRARPVALETKLTPPQPRLIASLAAHWRRIRSSISGVSDRYFCRIRSAVVTSCTGSLSSRLLPRLQKIAQVIFSRCLIGVASVAAYSPQFSRNIRSQWQGVRTAALGGSGSQLNEGYSGIQADISPLQVQ